MISYQSLLLSTTVLNDNDALMIYIVMGTVTYHTTIRNDLYYNVHTYTGLKDVLMLLIRNM